MAVIFRNKGWSFAWRFDGRQKWIATSCKTKGAALRLERECLNALDRKSFFNLTPEARDVLIRLHQAMQWDYPGGLFADDEAEEMPQDIVLWDEERPKRGAVQIFFADRIIRQKPESTLQRYSMCIVHLTRLLKSNKRMADIWTDEIREYYAQRIDEGASPNTIGWEISTLSGIFGVLVNKKKITGISENPCRNVRGRDKSTALNFKSKTRQAYLSDSLVRTTLMVAYNKKTERTVVPPWLKSLILTSFYTGMRLGEILYLKRHQVFLNQRMIFFGAEDIMAVKERQPKRIPIHHDLVPILERALSVTALGHNHVFLLTDGQGTRPITKDCVELAMRRLNNALNPSPRVHFHDMRHSFRANCARSGISDRIAERILGHADKSGYLDGDLPVSQRYGEISDDELVQAIDKLTFNHGDSRINGRPVVLKSVSWVLAGGRFSEKQALDTETETL
ncbi:MAG: tyrosine-type recombinase/integrase [Desulfomonilaceae bacterium]